MRVWNQSPRKSTDSVALTPADNAIKNSPLRRLRLQLGFFARQRTIERWRVSQLNKLESPSDTLSVTFSKEKIKQRNKIQLAAERLNACIQANLNEPKNINATLLDLGGLDLDEVPNIFGGCPNLKTIIASGNNFLPKDYPKSLLALEKSCNIIEALPVEWDQPAVLDTALILENYQHIEKNKAPNNTSTSTSTTIQQSTKVITLGLPNLGNTCYANAAIKYLASSYGTELLTHLRKLSKEDRYQVDTKFHNAINELAITIKNLVSGSTIIAYNPKQHMKKLFTALNELFKQKSIKFELNDGEQNDSHDFIRALNDAFKLDAIESTKISSRTIIRNKITGQIIRETPQELNTIHISLADANSGSSQPRSFEKLFSPFNESAVISGDKHSNSSVTVTKEERIVTDANKIKKIKTTITPCIVDGEIVGMKDINYDTKFTQIVTDEKSGSEYELTLQADSIIGFSGSIAQDSGHYVAFSRNDDTDTGSWSIHDDDKVNYSATLLDVHEKSKDFQPTTITFKVVSKKLISSRFSI